MKSKANHNGTMLLIMVSILFLGIFMAFATGAVQLLFEKIGANLTTMVTNVFSEKGMN